MGTVPLFLRLFISREVEPRLPVGLWALGASPRFPGGLSGPLATGCLTLDGDSGPGQPKEGLGALQQQGQAPAAAAEPVSAYPEEQARDLHLPEGQAGSSTTSGTCQGWRGLEVDPSPPLVLPSWYLQSRAFVGLLFSCGAQGLPQS